MNDEQMWPRSEHNPADDVQQLLNFVDDEIVTLEFIQAVDGELEPELARAIVEYRKAKAMIREVVALMKGV